MKMQTECYLKQEPLRNDVRFIFLSVVLKIGNEFTDFNEVGKKFQASTCLKKNEEDILLFAWRGFCKQGRADLVEAMGV